MIRPVWSDVEILLIVRCRSARPSGPIFLYHAMSIRWEAIFCPLSRRIIGLDRCISGLK